MLSSASFAELLHSLTRGAEPPDLGWLRRSWEQPDAFWAGLHAHWNRLLPIGAKSVVGKHYDFYHDTVIRHYDSPTPALRWHDGKDWHSFAYAEIGRMADGYAGTWSAAGVRAGDLVALVQPDGPEWLAQLLAIWRLGAVVCAIPPQGRTFLGNRLVALDPRWLAVDRLYLNWLPAALRDRALPHAHGTTPLQVTQTFESGTPAAWCFDPTAPEPPQAQPVSADRLYLGSLRDGVIGLGLAAGHSLAAPGWNALSTQPALALAVLLCGGTLVQIKQCGPETWPQRLAEVDLDVVGVSRTLREAWSRQPVRLSKPWPYWFRHPGESSDLPLWETFRDQAGLGDALCGNLVYSAPLGGMVLFSTRQAGQPHTRCLPVAGWRWRLSETAAPDQPSRNGVGRLSWQIPGAEGPSWAATPHVLAPFRDEWLYLGVEPAGRAGLTYPKAEVLAALAGISRSLTLVEQPPVDHDRGGPSQILLSFDRRIDTAELRRRLTFELGETHLPDLIETIDLIPKRGADGHPDHAWCQSRYLYGELYRRPRSPIHRCLAALKDRLLNS